MNATLVGVIVGVFSTLVAFALAADSLLVSRREFTAWRDTLGKQLERIEARLDRALGEPLERD